MDKYVDQFLVGFCIQLISREFCSCSFQLNHEFEDKKRYVLRNLDEFSGQIFFISQLFVISIHPSDEQILKKYTAKRIQIRNDKAINEYKFVHMFSNSNIKTHWTSQLPTCYS